MPNRLLIVLVLATAGVVGAAQAPAGSTARPEPPTTASSRLLSLRLIIYNTNLLVSLESDNKGSRAPFQYRYMDSRNTLVHLLVWNAGV